MAKIEYISLGGLRVDGRRPGEVRNIEILCGAECGVDVIEYDGVAQVSHGLTKVQAYVSGPSEGLKSRQRPSFEGSDSAVDIECSLSLASDKRGKPSKSDHQTADLTRAVVSTFERMIVGHLYRNSTIHIFVNVLEADGGVKSAVLNAVLVALVDAGIAMRDLIAACSCVLLDGHLLLDSNQVESNAAIMELTLASSVSKGEIIYMDLKSRHAIKSVSEIVDFTHVGSRQFSQLAKDKLKRYAHAILEVNRLAHQ